MAQDDLIDLDKLLEEELERQANPPPIWLCITVLRK